MNDVADKFIFPRVQFTVLACIVGIIIVLEFMFYDKMISNVIVKESKSCKLETFALSSEHKPEITMRCGELIAPLRMSNNGQEVVHLVTERKPVDCAISRSGKAECRVPQKAELDQK